MVPPVLQLTSYGPAPVPDEIVAPSKFQVKVALALAVPVKVMVEFWPMQAGDVAVKGEVGKAEILILIVVSAVHCPLVTARVTG